MGAVVGGLVVFGLLAILVLNAMSGGDDRDEVPAFLTVGVWITYLVHADTVLTAAYLDVLRVDLLPATPALVTGLVISMAGFGLFLGSTRILARDGRFEGLVTRSLVTSGPYRRMRHPQDTGWGITLLGIAIAGRSVVALALVMLFGIFLRRLWRSDDDQLAERFGEPYLAYRAMTPASLAL